MRSGCRSFVAVGAQSAAERTRREILRNDCFDRLRGELGATFDEVVARRLVTIAGDVATNGLGLDAGRARSCSRPATSSSTPRRRFTSTPRSTPPSRSICSDRRGSRRRFATRIASAAPPLPHLISVSTAYVNCGHQGDAYEQPITESPYLALPDWRGEVAASRRARSRRRRPEPGAEATARVRTQGARQSSAPPAPRCSPSAPSGFARSGSTTDSSSSAAPAPRPSDGRTPTRSPSPSARSRSATPRATSPSRSSVLRSSSRRSPSRARAGSAAFAWPSR